MSFFDFEAIYNTQYKKTYLFLKRGLTGDIDQDITTLESTIKTLFDLQGLDWSGRGDLFLERNQASIAAAETLLSELRNKK